MKSWKCQTGATLVVSLLMLIILTLIAVTAINTSSIDLRIVHNLQLQQEAEAAAQQAIEQVISSIANFNAPAAQTITVNSLAVTVAAPQCLRGRIAPGYSAVWGLAPQDTYWNIRAVVTDPATGAQATLHQGVEIRLPAGSCL